MKGVEWNDIYGGVGRDPVRKMATGMTNVRSQLEDATIEAADGGPGEYVFIEVDG